MSKNSTDPGLGSPVEHFGDTVKEPVRIETEAPPLADTVVDAPVEPVVEPLVARYRTDPRAPVTPEMAMLRGIRGQKKGGLVGFRDGLEDVRKGSVVQAERDAALARLAEEGKAGPAHERTQPLGPAEPTPQADSKAVKQLIGLGVVVVLIGIGVLVAIRWSTQEVTPTSQPSAQASTPAPPTTTTAPSIPHPAPATPSAAATSSTHGAPELPTAKSLPSVPSTTKPEPKPPTPPPTAPTVSAKPTSAPTAVPTVFDPTQGT
jgi:hypothetical protein